MTGLRKQHTVLGDWLNGITSALQVDIESSILSSSTKFQRRSRIVGLQLPCKQPRKKRVFDSPDRHQWLQTHIEYCGEGLVTSEVS